nr:MFS-type transporter clz9-like [Hydra vulgaris]
MVIGCSKYSAAKQYKIPRQTLHDYIKRAPVDNFVKKLRAGHPRTLSVFQEKELIKVLLNMSQRLFGLSPKDVKQMVFQFCEENRIVHKFNCATKSAGKEWFREKIMFNANGMQIIQPSNLFNVDESGLSICLKPGKIVALKEKHSVGGLTSSESGKTITIVCCQSASGFFVPPTLIYPRIRVKSEFLDKAPIGSISDGSKNGWIKTELFEIWFDHYLQAVRPQSRNQPVLLILDGHSSHKKYLSVIKKARHSNVLILSLPSHCTHKLQPLDVSFFKSLKIFYDQEVSTWLRRHPGRPVTELEVGELFGKAYGKAATVQNCQSGFKKCGIYPFDRNVFTEEDFAAAKATDPSYVVSKISKPSNTSEMHPTLNNGLDSAKELDNIDFVTGCVIDTQKKSISPNSSFTLQKSSELATSHDETSQPYGVIF